MCYLPTLRMSAVACITLTTLALVSTSARAVDLTKIDRTIAKEPKYQAAYQEYCLLVFGLEAKTRVWVVHDGNVFYVDRNGNGDLTEPDEKIDDRQAISGAGINGKPYKELDGTESEMFVKLWIATKEGGLRLRTCKGGWQEFSENVVTARDSKDAPIVHFHGPLSLVPSFNRPGRYENAGGPLLSASEPVTIRRGQIQNLILSAGRTGRGVGTTVVRYKSEESTQFLKRCRVHMREQYTGQNGEPIVRNTAMTLKDT